MVPYHQGVKKLTTEVKIEGDFQQLFKSLRQAKKKKAIGTFHFFKLIKENCYKLKQHFILAAKTGLRQ